MDLEKNFRFYSDSQIAPGCITNEWVGFDHSVNLINGSMLLLTKIRQIWVLDRSMLKNSLKVVSLSTTFVGAHENFDLILDDDKEVRPIVAINGRNM